MLNYAKRLFLIIRTLVRYKRRFHTLFILLCQKHPFFSFSVCVCFKQAQKSDGEAEDIGMGMSLAQAKERAHQKRAAKKAPQMDWRKRNELFSSL